MKIAPFLFYNSNNSKKTKKFRWERREILEGYSCLDEIVGTEEQLQLLVLIAHNIVSKEYLL